MIVFFLSNLAFILFINVSYFAETTCPIPEIKNGRVSSSTLPKFQETLTVTCDVGYIVNGSATITCGDDRNFDAVPNCIGKKMITGRYILATI